MPAKDQPCKKAFLKRAALAFLHTWQMRNWQRRAQVAGRKSSKNWGKQRKDKIVEKKERKGSQGKTRKEAGKRKREGRKKRKSSLG